MAPKPKVARSRAYNLAQQVNNALGVSALKLGNDDRFSVARIPSGSLTIDRITGGGFALGRHVELYGSESSGKSFIMYRTMALSQERGNVCALIDPEHSFDEVWFRHLGGKPEELITSWPETAEEATSAMMLLFQSGEVEVVGVDSVSALLTREERETSPDKEDRIASQARFMSRSLRRLTTINQRTLILWINQERTKIGGYSENTTSGGKALRYYDTTRIELRRGENVDRPGKKASKGKLVEARVKTGHWVYAKSQKEKSSMPFQEGSFIFDNTLGQIDLSSEIVQLGLEDGWITRTGNTFSFEDVDGTVHDGAERKFKNQIATNDQLRQELIELIEDRTIQNSVPRGMESKREEETT